MLTFGRRGAAALRDRIEARIVGVAGRGMRDRRAAGPHLLTRTRSGCCAGAAAERGEPAPRLLTGPEQDLVIRELLEAAVDDARRTRGWPESLRPALRTRAFASQLRDLLLRAAERGRRRRTSWPGWAGGCGRADWVGRGAFPRGVHRRCSRCATPPAAARVATTRPSWSGRPTGLLADDPALLAAERRRLRYVYVDELADTDPAQIDLLSPGRRGRQAAGRLRRPGLLDVRLPRRRPERSSASSRSGSARAAGAPARTVTLGTSYRCGAGAAGGDPPGGRPAARPGRPPRAAHRRPDAPRRRRWRCAAFRSVDERGGVRGAPAAGGAPAATACRGRGWRWWSAPPRRSCRRCSARCTRPACRPSTHAEDLPLHQQPAVAPLAAAAALRAGAAAAGRGGRGRAAALAARRRRPARRAAAAAGAAGAGRSPPATGGPPASCWSRRCATRRCSPPCERRWAAPGAGGRPAARHRPGGRRRARAPPPRTCCGRSGGTAGWPTGGSARSGGAGGGRTGWRAAADRDLDAVMALFDAAARFADRLPGARTEVFLDHVLGQELPADTLAPTADRGEAVRMLTAHAAKGPGVGRRGGRRRAGGRLAGPAAARQRARLGAAGRRARRAGPARATPARGGGPDRRRCWTRSAGCSTWPSPGRAAAAGHRGRPARSAAAARSSRAGSCTSWRVGAASGQPRDAPDDAAPDAVLAPWTPRSDAGLRR